MVQKVFGIRKAKNGTETDELLHRASEGAEDASEHGVVLMPLSGHV